MKCPKCGVENANDLTYCLSCGNKLKDTPPISLDSFVVSLPPKTKRGKNNASSEEPPYHNNDTVSPEKSKKSCASEQNQARQKKATWPIWLTALLGIASAIILFIYRVCVMEFLYQNISILRDNVAFADEIWPMILLIVPWIAFVLIMLFILRIIARIFGKHSHRKTHPFLKTILIIIILAAIGMFVYDYFNPGFVQSIPEWFNQTIEQLTVSNSKASNDVQTMKLAVPVQDDAHTNNDVHNEIEMELSVNKSEATTIYASITFTVKKKGNSKGVLIIESGTNETWKFAPWVGHSTTVTLVRSDGTKSYAEINTDNMFFKYKTGNFDKGKTFEFDLQFDDQSQESWSKVIISIASFLKTHDVEVSFS